MSVLYLRECEVTDPEMWSEITGKKVEYGDKEYRLLDDPERPSSSSDFLSKSEALAWADQMGFCVVMEMKR